MSDSRIISVVQRITQSHDIKQKKKVTKTKIGQAKYFYFEKLRRIAYGELVITDTLPNLNWSLFVITYAKIEVIMNIFKTLKNNQAIIQ